MCLPIPAHVMRKRSRRDHRMLDSRRMPTARVDRWPESVPFPQTHCPIDRSSIIMRRQGSLFGHV
jgi:hypothetical protein